MKSPRFARLFFSALFLVSLLFIAQAARSATWTLGTPEQPIPDPGVHASAAVSADFNKDGKADLALTDGATNKAVIFLGRTPSGLYSWSLEKAGSYSVGSRPVAISKGVLLGNTNIDLVTANYNGSGSLSILPGNGNGTFGSESRINLGAGYAPVSIGVAGLGNGHADVYTVVNTPGGAQIRSYMFDGSGGPPALSSHSLGARTSDNCLAADFDNDSKPDMAVLDHYSDFSGDHYEFAIYKGQGNGDFTLAATYELHSQGTKLVSRNFASGDTYADIAVLSATGFKVYTFTGNGDCTFNEGQTLDIPVTATGPSDIIAPILNNDGRWDIAVANGGTTVSYFLGNGDGTFQGRQDALVSGGAGWLEWDDIDGDGVRDLITGDLTHTNFSVLRGVLKYTLTTSASPAEGGTVTSGGDYTPGTVVDITANPGANYNFVSWTGAVANAGSASTTVTMDADKTVTANFQLKAKRTLTTAVSPSNSGTVQVTETGPYNSGDTVHIQATAAKGYKFSQWTGQVADVNSASTTVTMDADKSVTANFVKNGIKLSKKQNGNVVNLTAEYYSNGSPVPIGTTLKYYVKYSLDGVTWPATPSTKTLGKTIDGTGVVHAKPLKAKNGYYRFQACYIPKGQPIVPGDDIIDCKVQPVIVASGPLDKTVIAESAPAISWQAYDGAIGYDVQISTSKKFTTLLATNSYAAGTTSGTLPTLTAGLKTYWRVVARLEGDSTSVGSTPRLITYVPPPAP